MSGVLNSGTVTNLYCPVELAEAVYAAAGYSPEDRAGWGIEESRRAPERFVWVCAGTTPEQASASVGEMLQAYFDGIAKPRLQPSMPAIERRENESILAGLTIGPTGFLDEVGRNQMCFETYDPAGEEWIEMLVKRIRDALRH